ncbi:MAG: OB-fold nucleic acid binding domain-containing protein, partial [Nitrososphaerota archaeon]
MVKKTWIRTHVARQIKPELNGQEVHLVGWVHEIRDLGGIKFILLRDASGICQITAKKSELSKDELSALEELGNEDV